jgi:Zn-dependent protease
MTADAGAPSPLFPAVGRTEPHPPEGFALRRDDFGAFRALEPGTNDLVVLRPTTDGLRIERREARELVPWSAVVGLALTFTDAGRAKVPTVRVQFSAGPSLDYADALAPGSDDLPLTLGPGQHHLLRVERCRMLTAVIASAAGLAPATPREFHRGPRGVPVPELAIRPRVLPKWTQPLLLALSVAAFVFVLDVRWITAALVTAVLLSHELGHAFVMRLCGMKVRGVVFVPLFGAATLPEHSFATRDVEARVSLAGPATGLFSAGVLAIVLVVGPPAWMGPGAVGIALLWALAVNLLNLVPMPPLDGGRVLSCLCAGLPAAPRAVVAYVPIVAVGIVLVIAAWGSQAAIVAAGVFLAFAVSLTNTSLRRQSFLDWMGRLPQPLMAVRASLRDVTHGFTGRAREDVDGGVAPTPLTGGQMVAVVAMYAGLALALLAAAVVFVMVFPHATDALGSGG